ncbi:hypothetical protein T492DRAFT_953301 [Pavlovales sp. CCMP2436]|nr:hypothetical protein T492DRAFT_953301 [Pavlovales sp. CCMP2436]|mmetsp:Transcript_26897/g.68132  ORF Transcript_26897/g.68132 Transcript_26897/m.68132 type:complete len:153 (+) Transcript_26897:304-762(+)
MVSLCKQLYHNSSDHSTFLCNYVRKTAAAELYTVHKKSYASLQVLSQQIDYLRNLATAVNVYRTAWNKQAHHRRTTARSRRGRQSSLSRRTACMQACYGGSGRRSRRGPCAGPRASLAQAFRVPVHNGAGRRSHANQTVILGNADCKLDLNV